MNRHFSADIIQMAKKHVRSGSISLTIRKMQMKIAVRYYLPSLRWLLSKTPQKRSFSKDAVKLGPLSNTFYGKQYSNYSKN